MSVKPACLGVFGADHTVLLIGTYNSQIGAKSVAALILVHSEYMLLPSNISYRAVK